MCLDPTWYTSPTSGARPRRCPLPSPTVDGSLPSSARPSMSGGSPCRPSSADTAAPTVRRWPTPLPMNTCAAPPGCKVSDGAVDSPRSTGPSSLRGPVYEFARTTILLFAVVTVVRWLRDPGSGLFIAHLCPALAAIGAITAVLLVTLIRSPPARGSGGHMNPAVTVAVWLLL
jgi:hypothetical protein